jgi:iron complex outermembrane recepter protein
MKHILFFCMAFVHVYYTAGQNSLKGIVKNRTSGEIIPGALIYIADLKNGVSSNENGTYVITGLPKGNFLVECKVIGFNTTTKKIHIEGETTLDFEIEETAVEIQEVTVTGSSQSTELKDNPISMAIVNQNMLFENTSTNLIDNIAKTPGVNQLSTGAGISKPVIRGLGYNRIVTLNNSIRQEGQQWGDEHGIEIDEFSVDRVEIIKGPGSLMYGSDAIAGVVNFLPAYPLPLGQIKGGIMANYQTNNSLQAYSVYTAGNIKNINWLVRGSAKQAGNYRNAYDSYVYNSGFQEYDVNGHVGTNSGYKQELGLYQY